MLTIIMVVLAGLSTLISVFFIFPFLFEDSKEKDGVLASIYFLLLAIIFILVAILFKLPY